MKIRELFPEIRDDIEINGVCINSNEVRHGSLFIALPGEERDGNDFIGDAAVRGAAAVITEKECPAVQGPKIIRVKSARRTAWIAAKHFYKDPSSLIKVTGITGTNGKTTTSYILKNISDCAGEKAGLLGTINYIVGHRSIPASLTTPDTIKLNKYLLAMTEEGCKRCIMEVSSHALAQERTGGIIFRTAVYTNLDTDHTDYHKTETDYLRQKIKLFTGLRKNSWAAVNADDRYCRKIAENTPARLFFYGINNISEIDYGLKVSAESIEMSSFGMEFIVNTYGLCGKFHAETSLIGIHNVYNILAAVSAALTMNIPVPAIKKGILMTKTVCGRMESVAEGQPFGVFIDYAHTPAALKNILETLRKITRGRILLVAGCGGDRDKKKRPVMGRIAGIYADMFIITNDNPRTENPAQIISDIAAGAAGSNYRIIEDRKEAICKALALAKEGDTVIVAGKGHENYQILRNTVVPFNDKDIITKYLKEYECTVC